MVEARYALGMSALFLLIGLGAIALNTALYLFSSSHYPMLWVLGVVAAGLGLRAIDRRVKLRIGAEGLFHTPWGVKPIPWSEFEGFAVFNRRNVSWIEARTKYPDQFRARLPLSARLDAWVNERFGRPLFYINPTQLDIPIDEILEALQRHRPAA